MTDSRTHSNRKDCYWKSDHLREIKADHRRKSDIQIALGPILENKVFSEFVSKRAKINSDVVPKARDLEKRIVDFISEIKDLLVRFEFENSPDLKATNQLECVVELISRAKNALEFVLVSSASSFRHTLDAYVYALNTANYWFAVSASRSMLERIAVLNACCLQLSAALTKATNAKNTHDLPQHVMGLMEISRIVNEFVMKTRFNWEGRPDTKDLAAFANFGKVSDKLKATSIMTFIDKLPQSNEELRFYYEAQSDFVHPNRGAHFLAITQALPLGDDRYLAVLEHGADSEELLELVFHVTAVPLTAALGIAGNAMDWLREGHSLVKIWQSHFEKSAKLH